MSQYGDDFKKNKRINIKSLSLEICEKVIAFQKNENLSPVIKTYLEMFKQYIEKIKGASI